MLPDVPCPTNQINTQFQFHPGAGISIKIDTHQIKTLAKLLSEKNAQKRTISPPSIIDSDNIDLGQDLGDQPVVTRDVQEDESEDEDYGSPPDDEGEMWICEEHLQILQEVAKKKVVSR
jgi:hypothetical protein